MRYLYNYYTFGIFYCQAVIQARSHEIFRVADDIYAMETLEALDDITISVCAVAPPKPYYISPSAIGTRYKFCGISTVDNSLQYSLSLARNDPRRWGPLVGARCAGYLTAMANNAANMVELAHGVTGIGVLEKNGVEKPTFCGLLSAASGIGKR